jgi:ATP-dependent RNA helicase RhlB
MLFSATLSYRVLALTYDYMNLPEFISVTPEEISLEGIEQTLFHVGSKEKFRLLLGLLEREDWTRVLIFVNTRAGVTWLTKKLRANKLPAEGITGEMPQRTRLKLMERFKGGRIKILLATDVASRGIHVEDISHVINYDLPQDPENYTHRIGRTARAGKTGRALSLACEEYVFHLEAIEKMLGSKIPVAWPQDDWFVEDKSGPVSTRRRDTRTKTVQERKTLQERPRSPRRQTGTSLKTKNNVRFSSHEGGVFGLAPAPHPGADAASLESRDRTEGKKKKRARPKKKRSPQTA